MTTSTVPTATAQLEGLIASVTPEQAEAPTPCRDWAVRDLVDHVVHSTGGMVQMLQGEEVDWSAPVVHHDDPLAEFRRRAADLAAAAEDGPPGLATAELAVHAWDLATALGRSTDDFDPQVAEEGLAFMQANLTEDQRGGAFDPAQEPPAGANAYERIAAFAGRSVAETH